MDKKHKKAIWIAIFVIISMLGLARLSSGELDKKADLLIEQMYKHDQHGVIDGAQSIIYQAGNNQAIIFIHGFASTPLAFADLINDIKDKANSDIYAPLLPYDGRNLQTLSKTNNQVVLNYLDNLITQISKMYKKVTIVGLSYGGARLAKLAADNKIPNNATLILYAPALYLKSNNFIQINLAKAYTHWRKYCDSTILGCEYPSYQSADETGKQQFTKQKDFPYLNIPALLTMYKFDLDNRDILNNINRPYNIIIAKDDNRVSYSKIKEICYKNNKYCRLYSFYSGKHLIHWGKNKHEFESLLLKISMN